MIGIKADVRDAWLKALRGGEYQQGSGRLRRRESFCCLGVLSDLAVKAGIGEWRGETYVAPNGEHRGEYLCSSVSDWIGLGSTDLWVGENLVSELNDKGKTFIEIADAIEAHTIGV